ncbi:EXS family protein/ERD1/XPR1/SYG1 family protein [Rhodotorula toruloides ATCC 204091]|uniref:BY PROTMAP: gi/342320342/gb/EGU12283.1/ EXS family protein/ERD1/XPR1/SYG1 family protein [Rhodotorula glutinis ATCC 204091] n=1 Tax=Rhodotorula toruloides TaxID=5286 RepID=A0A0K3CW07_RHOTO|nr:EXS family protein/ERD1/XPR1/SYG1 family protein [Rhodotorula toruloides ATCC 204091]
MKFGRYLAAHQIDEWKRAYIDYRKLKKQIGRAEEELFDIDSGGIGETGEAGEDVRETAQDDERRAGSARRLQRQTSSSAAPEAVEEDGVAEAANGRDLERGSSENDDDDEPTSPSSHNKRSQNSSSRAVKSRQSQPPASTPPHSPGLSSSSHEHVSDTTQNTDRPLVTRKESSKSGISLKQQTSEQPLTQRHTRRFSTSKPAQGPRGQDGRWRKGLKSNMELSEVYERIPPQCRRFFTLLDRELERVTSFYADRETEATKRFEQLDAQWKELANHKKEFQAFRERELHPPQFVTSILPKRGHLPNVPGSHLVRRTLAHRRRQLADAAHMGNGDQPERRLSGESEDSHERGGDEHAGDADDEGTAREQVFKQVRPEDYTNARSKLKLATFEYYRYLGMLKSYRVLNRTGFAKALKKYEKATQIPCAVKYSEKVEKANFVASTKLDDLIRETENAFANVFERGDRKKALERLRDFGEKKRHHFSTWRAGMFMGAGLPLMIEGLVLTFKASTRREIPYWPALLQLFGACYLPVFFSLAFFLNLATWSYARINYVLIFELDVRTKLDYHQYLELPAVLYFTLSLFFWAAWNNFWPDQIAPSAYPLAWIVFMLLIMLNPFPILYPAARWWLLRSFCRMITSGLVAVEFRDFFLGDEFNSIYYSVYNLGFLYCTYNHGWAPNVQQTCSTNKTWTSAVLASLPPFWRLGQSIRRYVDSDGMYLHLLNAGKYSMTILYFFFYFSWRIITKEGKDVPWRFALFILFASANSIYTSAWDLLMDWSLGHRNTKKREHYLLRNELAFFKDTPWVYFLVCIANVLLRFTWVIYLSPRPSPPVQSYIIALTEAGRRIMWNTFRVEAEHIGNRDGFRVTREVGLPYVTASSPEASGGLVDNGTSDEDEHLTHRQRFFKFFHTLHASVAKNFQPVFDAVTSPPILSLGRRVDNAERETREVVEEERRNDFEKKRTHQRRMAARKRKGRGTLGPDEESSSPSQSDDDDSREEGEQRCEHGRSSGSRASSRPGSNVEEEDAAKGAHEARVDEAERTTHGPKHDAREMRQDESDHNQEDDDIALEEGMRDVEQMNKVADGGMKG